MKILFLILPLWVGARWALAQIPDREDADLQRLTDEIFGVPDAGAEANYEELYENLTQILRSPLELNSVSHDELARLHILSDQQIDNLLAYRADQGSFLDVHELQVIPGFTSDVVARLLPFVHVRDPHGSAGLPLLRRILAPGQSYVIARYERTLESRRGFLDDSLGRPFAGTAPKVYVRARTSAAGDFSIGFTGEKDAGEQMIFKPRDHHWGFDFTSWHIQLQNKGWIRNLVVGDFQAQFGQGLILGGAFGMGKGAETVSTTRKSGMGFMPYTSVHEGAYHRGAAITARLAARWELSASYSRVKRDATVDSTEGPRYATALQTTGYHRTASELEKRKKLTEETAAMVLRYTSQSIDVALIGHVVGFDVALRKAPRLYRHHAFAGSRQLNTGASISYRVGNMAFFGEFARAIGGGNAALAGILVTPHPAFDLSLLYRNYQPDYHTFYANAFAESTLPQNERGFYWGWKYRIRPTLSTTGFLDLFVLPTIGFRRYAPSRGHEWMWRINYEPSKRISIFLQLRQEVKARNSPSHAPQYAVYPGTRRNVAIQFDCGIRNRLRLKSRIQYNEYDLDGNASRGFVAAQDLSFTLGRFRFTARHALFDAGSYDNRHYVYEHDAWMAYSFPAYTGTGVRNYALFEFKLHKNVTVWIRYARTRLADATEIGSGMDLIEGNTRNDVKFQARLKF